MTDPTDATTDATTDRTAGEPTPHETALAVMRDMASGTLLERMGIEVTEATPERLVATMPVAGNTQPYGLLHGGASVVLAESLGSIGAATGWWALRRPRGVAGARSGCGRRGARGPGPPGGARRPANAREPTTPAARR